MDKNQMNFTVVSKEFMDELKNDIAKLFELLKTSKGTNKEVISEKEAQELLGRKTTWFFEMRKSGKLPYSKAGSKVYYQKSDLFNLIKKIS